MTIWLIYHCFSEMEQSKHCIMHFGQNIAVSFLSSDFSSVHPIKNY